MPQLRRIIDNYQPLPDFKKEDSCLFISASWNVLTEFFDHAFETKNHWQEREKYISQALNYIKPDIIGLQELSIGQAKTLDKILPTNYKIIARSDYYGTDSLLIDDSLFIDEPGKISYACAYSEAIVYNKDRLNLIADQANHWQFQNAKRLNLAAIFEDKICNHHVFSFFTTHYPFNNLEARKHATIEEKQFIQDVNTKYNISNYITVGDRNSIEDFGAQWYNHYYSNDLVEFRDNKNYQHYGTSTTFIGLNTKNWQTDFSNNTISTIDLGFNSGNIEGIASFHYCAKIDAESEKILPIETALYPRIDSDLFASDHCMTGQVARFYSDETCLASK